MSMQDPIADLLTCIRNAQMMGKKFVDVPYSRLKSDIMRVLHDEGYLQQVETKEEKGKKILHATLKYYQGKPVIEKIARVSKPALRRYAGYQTLPLVRGGLGIAVVSTPGGVMSDRSARSKKMGGEILCIVE